MSEPSFEIEQRQTNLGSLGYEQLLEQLAAARDRERALRGAVGNLRDSLLLARSIAASGEALSDKAREQISRSIARADAALAPETHDEGRERGWTPLPCGLGEVWTGPGTAPETHDEGCQHRSGDGSLRCRLGRGHNGAHALVSK